MKTFPLILALALTTGTCFAQVLPGTNVKVRHHHSRKFNTGNPQALAALQTDLTTAIKDLTAALPIYDGYRVKSIHSAHRALLVVDKAISATAAIRPKPTVRDQVPSTKAHTKYSAAQITASQTNMQQGLAMLAQAQKDLVLAAGANPNKKAYKIDADLKKSISEATTAMNIHYH